MNRNSPLPPLALPLALPLLRFVQILLKTSRGLLSHHQRRLLQSPLLHYIHPPPLLPHYCALIKLQLPIQSIRFLPQMIGIGKGLPLLSFLIPFSRMQSVDSPTARLQRISEKNSPASLARSGNENQSKGTQAATPTPPTRPGRMPQPSYSTTINYKS